MATLEQELNMEYNPNSTGLCGMPLGGCKVCSGLQSKRPCGDCINSPSRTVYHDIENDKRMLGFYLNLFI